MPAPTASPTTSRAAPAETTPAATEPEIALSTEPEEPAAQLRTASVDGEVFDDSRDRAIPYRVFAPVGTGPRSMPIIVISHGGTGSDAGWTRGNHLGEGLASNGFFAVHIGHLESGSVAQHRLDRPADVTFVLDQIAGGLLAEPTGFDATPDLGRVGHTGHSFGAYTSHAVGGAIYTHGQFRDERVDAIAPISPQGFGGMGSFDNGNGDTTWSTVDVPTYDFIGADEMNRTATGAFRADGWRLDPYNAYTDAAKRYVAIIGGQDHFDMYENGPDEVKRFIVEELVTFFGVHVAHDTDIAPCDIGGTATPLNIDTRRTAQGCSMTAR